MHYAFEIVLINFELSPLMPVLGKQVVCSAFMGTKLTLCPSSLVWQLEYIFWFRHFAAEPWRNHGSI